MAVADGARSFTLTGNGDVLEPEDGVIAIGSGGNYALAAARALMTVDGLSRRGGRAPGHAHRRRHLRLHQPLRHRGDPSGLREEHLMDVPTYSPREIVSELDRFIVGQTDAKRAVAIALRNRWRRAQLAEGMRDEVVPKNILMIGPTGCGKTEIARRLAKLAQAPFLKVEATKFTEVGYVGRDVESIVRDLVEVSLNMLRETRRRTCRPRPSGGRGAAGRRAGGRDRVRRHQAQVPPHAAGRRAGGQGGRGRDRRRAGPRQGRWTSPACRPAASSTSAT